jgi:hypothetical protein
MNTRTSAEIRRLVSTVNQANAFELFDRIQSLVGDRIVRRGRARKNDLLDRLVSTVANKALGKPTRLPPQWYFELRGLWQVTFQLGWCHVWVLYDEVDEVGIAAFARRDVPLPDWFFALSRAQLRNDAHELA